MRNVAIVGLVVLLLLVAIPVYAGNGSGNAGDRGTPVVKRAESGVDNALGIAQQQQTRNGPNGPNYATVTPTPTPTIETVETVETVVESLRGGGSLWPEECE